MKIFPSDRYSFKLIDGEKETLERLNARTEKSESLYSRTTTKSFIGQVHANEFRIVTSDIGSGALCVLSGKIEKDFGHVDVELNRPFKILFSVLFVLPIIALIIQFFKKPEDLPVLFIVAIGQVLLIRFFFIELFFYRRFSKRSLNRLSDVLNTELMIKM